MSPTLFRFILVAYLGLSLVDAAFTFIIPSGVPDVLAHAQQANYVQLSAFSHKVLHILARAVLVGSIASVLGFYLFRPWAPRLGVAVTVLALFIWPLMGFIVISGWHAVISSLAGTLWGAILALAYFSPIRGRFFATR